jgi:NifU-like protein involved in Fe-S cluster formation
MSYAGTMMLLTMQPAAEAKKDAKHDGFGCAAIATDIDW